MLLFIKAIYVSLPRNNNDHDEKNIYILFRHYNFSFCCV